MVTVFGVRILRLSYQCLQISNLIEKAEWLDRGFPVEESKHQFFSSRLILKRERGSSAVLVVNPENRVILKL